MEISHIFNCLRERFTEAIRAEDPQATDAWMEVAPDHLREVFFYLRDDPQMQFQMLHCITAVDYLEKAQKPSAVVAPAGYLEVLYHLSSLVNRHRLVVKVRLPRWKGDSPGQLPELPTVSDIWRTAEWHEREVYDLSGIRFLGHPDMRRILCPEDWEGHPLRKDYQRPPQYHGIPSR